MGFQNRINYQGDLKFLLNKVCTDYKIGSYQSHSLIAWGYEDFNLNLTTTKGKFFVKIFNKSRNDQECKRYIRIIREALKNKIAHPNLFKSNKGYLYEIALVGKIDKLSVFEYIDGKTFFELNLEPTQKELSFIINQVAVINKIQLKPDFIYDSWAIINFLEEYRKKSKALTNKQKKLLQPLVLEFSNLKLNNLPHSLVHGDLIKTNLMKGENEKNYLIDFAATNYQPRIIELAVLFNDVFFNKNNPKKYYLQVLNEYQKQIHLTQIEIDLLPTFIKIGHAMHLLRASYEKVVNNNNSQENNYFLQLGEAGLTQM